MSRSLTGRQVTAHTDSIQTSKVLKAVEDHVLNGTDMDSTQLTGAAMLLDRTMPKLSAVEQYTEVHGTVQISVKLGD
jgi:hypothetical protein